MNKPMTTSKNNAKSIKNKTYNDWTSLIWTPVGTKAVKNPIENIAIIKQIFSKNSINLVSISYCDGI
jgi:hypothetical protein